LIPSDIKWDPNATPPQFTNNEDTVIEPDTHVRVKIIGTRTEVGEMWAIGSIKEDYLGYADDMVSALLSMLTLLAGASRINTRT
jgi:DNA-directed RNA polymerase II subunit RPB7